MQHEPVYAECSTSLVVLRERCSAAPRVRAGDAERVVVDPGIRLRQERSSTTSILRRSKTCSPSPAAVLLAGHASRRRASTGRGLPTRLLPSVAAALIAVQRAHAIACALHDVAATRRCLKCACDRRGPRIIPPPPGSNDEHDEQRTSNEEQRMSRPISEPTVSAARSAAADHARLHAAASATAVGTVLRAQRRRSDGTDRNDQPHLRLTCSSLRSKRACGRAVVDVLADRTVADPRRCLHDARTAPPPVASAS